MTLQELNQLVEKKSERIAECEKLAREHEQKARDYIAERSMLKIEVGELRQQVHNAATQAAVNQSMSAAEAARKSAEAEAEAAKKTRLENEALQAELKANLAELKAAKEQKAE